MQLQPNEKLHLKPILAVQKKANDRRSFERKVQAFKAGVRKGREHVSACQDTIMQAQLARIDQLEASLQHGALSFFTARQEPTAAKQELAVSRVELTSARKGIEALGAEN